MKFLANLWRFLPRAAGAVPSTPAPRKRRLEFDRLEDRALPSVAGGLPPGVANSAGRSQEGARTDVAAWSQENNHTFLDVQPQALLQSVYFNSPSTFQAYMQNFQGVLHRWVVEADHQGLTSDAALTQFLGSHLQTHFHKTRGVLASLYPGQNDQTYRMLMAMNLAHGYYVYATVPIANRTLYAQLHLRTGDCVEIAQLLQFLVKAEGIPARQLVQSYHYESPVGPFIASHDVVYAGGLWLDAEINTAFRVNLAQFVQVPPGQRLQSLLDHQQVFGFYDWYLNPQVRAEQLSRGLDGGIIAFYYQYYFAGIGQGRTRLTLENAL